MEGRSGEPGSGGNDSLSIWKGGEEEEGSEKGGGESDEDPSRLRDNVSSINRGEKVEREEEGGEGRGN